jgi:hypothetical protein
VYPAHYSSAVGWRANLSVTSRLVARYITSISCRYHWTPPSANFLPEDKSSKIASLQYAHSISNRQSWPGNVEKSYLALIWWQNLRGGISRFHETDWQPCAVRKSLGLEFRLLFRKWFVVALSELGDATNIRNILRPNLVLGISLRTSGLQSVPSCELQSHT